jgi:hypothetical protein
VNKPRYLKLASFSLLLIQILGVSNVVRADELHSQSALPEPLQGKVSAKDSTATNLQGTSSLNELDGLDGLNELNEPNELKALEPLNALESLHQAEVQNHVLFGNVERKGSSPQEANVSETLLQSQAAKTASTLDASMADALHKLAAQENIDDTQSHTWFKIPPWLAGKWKIQDRQLVGQVNYRTGKQTPAHPLSFDYCGEQYGLQQDKNGACWQFEKLGNQPSNYHIDKKGLAHFFVLESNQPLASSDTQLVLKKKWSTVVMNPTTKETIDVRHLESTLTFKRISEDTIEVADITSVFDRQRSPISRKWTQTTKVKIAPFAPINQRKGEDLRALFAAYAK